MLPHAFLFSSDRKAKSTNWVHGLPVDVGSLSMLLHGNCCIIYYSCFLPPTPPTFHSPLIMSSQREPLRRLEHSISQTRCVSIGNSHRQMRPVIVLFMTLFLVNSTFNCRTSGVVIEDSMVNDGFCDCEDGSDETDTHVCNSGFFTCQTELAEKGFDFVHSHDA